MLASMSDVGSHQPPHEVLGYYARGLENRRLSEGKGELDLPSSDQLVDKQLSSFRSVDILSRHSRMKLRSRPLTGRTGLQGLFARNPCAASTEA